MTFKITRPDGTIIEGEGTVEECERIAGAPPFRFNFNPSPLPSPFIPPIIIPQPYYPPPLTQPAPWPYGDLIVTCSDKCS